MPLIHPIDARGANEYKGMHDRILEFEHPLEVQYIQLAARARIAHRKEEFFPIGENDTHLAETLKPHFRSLYTNAAWIDESEVLFRHYYDIGFQYAKLPGGEPVHITREKVIEFSGALIIANQVFEGIRDLDAIELFANRNQH